MWLQGLLSFNPAPPLPRKDLRRHEFVATESAQPRSPYREESQERKRIRCDKKSAAPQPRSPSHEESLERKRLRCDEKSAAPQPRRNANVAECGGRD